MTVPESKGRKKKEHGVPALQTERKPKKIGSPSWLVPTMLTFFIIGLLYIVVFYIAGNDIPVMRDLAAIVNVGIGFGFIVVGFILSTRWY